MAANSIISGHFTQLGTSILSKKTMSRFSSGHIGWIWLATFKKTVASLRCSNSSYFPHCTLLTSSCHQCFRLYCYITKFSSLKWRTFEVLKNLTKGEATVLGWRRFASLKLGGPIPHSVDLLDYWNIENKWIPNPVETRYRWPMLHYGVRRPTTSSQASKIWSVLTLVVGVVWRYLS